MACSFYFETPLDPPYVNSEFEDDDFDSSEDDIEEEEFEHEDDEPSSRVC